MLPNKLLKDLQELLTITNPDYEKKIRMGFYAYNEPKKLVLFEKLDNDLILPYGMKNYVLRELDGLGVKYQVDYVNTLKPIEIKRKNDLTLYHYQQEAVDEVLKVDNGILISPCGSGKTRMGMSVIGKLGVKTLWITHTLDLLRQSRKTFKDFYKNKTGLIASGKIDIQDITFATVQSLSNLDLNDYKDVWEMIIVDEAHKATGSPTRLKMFYKIVNTLNAKYKFGLTATIEHKKGNINSTPFYLIGETIHEILEDDIPRINAEYTSIKLRTPASDYYLKPDKTLDYMKLVDYLVINKDRNMELFLSLLDYKDNYNIVLSNRIEHLELLSEMLTEAGLYNEVVIGSTKASIREKTFEKFREGKVPFLLANYQLVKEGLDLPIADRLHLVFPIKDKISLIQSKGRIERLYEGKSKAIIIDYVDFNIGYLARIYKERRKILNG